MSARKKNERGLTAADIARLSPAAREKLHAAGMAGDVPRKRQSKEWWNDFRKRPGKDYSGAKRYRVSWYFRGKRITAGRDIEAQNKTGAISEVKASLGSSAFDRRQRHRPTNFMAVEVRNPSKQRSDVRDQMSVKKKNLLGLGKRAKRRKRKRAAVAQAQADIAQAKARLLVAKARNPRKAVGRKKNKVSSLKSQVSNRRTVGRKEIRNPKSAIRNSVWPTAYRDQLPDSSFAFIESGGQKDSSGRTTPRKLRHFPIRDASGKLDPAHVRNALARLPQSSLTRAQETKAARVIFAAARALAIKNPTLAAIAPLYDTAQKAMYGNGHIHQQANPAKCVCVRMKRNPDLLDVFAKGSAGLLNLLQIRRHMSGGSKQRNRRRHSASGSGVGSTARSRRNAVGRKKNKVSSLKSQVSGVRRNGDTRDSLRRIHKEFLGRDPKGEIKTGVALEGTPPLTTMLGPLALVRLRNGNEQYFPVTLTYDDGKQVTVRNGTLPRRNGHIVDAKGCTQLAAANHGSLRRLYIVQDRPMAIRNGARNQTFDLGEAVRAEYWASKPHLYDGKQDCFLHYHDLGEEGGACPHVVMRNGVIGFQGGDYKIVREGIRD